ncbi:tetratricopeptide repeat protein [Edaphobacter sp. DSM 109919]|uniref:Tetratricopeptide repeat protein n=1 Tax=Edaphobacter paludis TaxID=3035702 RepID=A0AAU7CUK9_9BACT
MALLLFPLLALAQNEPANFEDVVARASAARQQNDLPRAIELYRQALQLKPSWPDGWWFLGSTQYAANDYPGAEDAITQYLKLTPNAAPAFALRGLCEFETGQYIQSIEDIDHGLSLGAGNQPRNEQILRFHEALSLTRTGQFESALTQYAFFAKNGISNPELFIGIGLAGLWMPQLPKDVEASQRDLVLAAGTAAYSMMAGDDKGGAQEFQDLFQRFPKAVNAHYLYGYLLFQTDQEHALAEFKQELAIDPSNTLANVMVAWTYMLQNKFSEGLSYARKSEAQEPNLTMAQLVLGRSLVGTGDIQGGLKYLEKARQQQPNNLEVHLALVRAYDESGRSEDARRERLLCLQLIKK